MFACLFVKHSLFTKLKLKPTTYIELLLGINAQQNDKFIKKKPPIF